MRIFLFIIFFNLDTHFNLKIYIYINNDSYVYTFQL